MIELTKCECGSQVNYGEKLILVVCPKCGLSGPWRETCNEAGIAWNELCERLRVGKDVIKAVHDVSCVFVAMRPARTGDYAFALGKVIGPWDHDSDLVEMIVQPIPQPLTQESVLRDLAIKIDRHNSRAATLTTTELLAIKTDIDAALNDSEPEGSAE